jgi:hypothetical protein
MSQLLERTPNETNKTQKEKTMLTKKTIHILLTVFAISTAFAQEHNHALTVPEVVYKGLDYAFEGQDTLETGLVTLKFDNIGQEDHHLQMGRLNDGVTYEAFMTTLQNEGLAAFGLLETVGGVSVLQPGVSQSVTVNLEKPGLYVALCVIPTADGTPHYALGMVKPIEVVAATAINDTEVLEADLTVQMLDFGYDVPTEIPAGEQVWEVINVGEQPHELAVGKLKPGKTVADVITFVQNEQQGEAPFEFMGGAQVMATGYSNFVEFDFELGDYVALCFYPDPATGLPHILLGMVRPFTVVERVSQQ